MEQGFPWEGLWGGPAMYVLVGRMDIADPVPK